MFFQAEDGIRDLVRSRGLGDVYKRQNMKFSSGASRARLIVLGLVVALTASGCSQLKGRPVSYTHLTLPTSDLV